MARNTFETDEELEIKLDFEKFKRLGKYIVPYKKTIFFILILMATSSIASMFIPTIFMKAMDSYIPNEDVKGIIYLALITLAISIYVSLVIKIRVRIMARLGQNIIYEIRKDIFTHIQALPFSYFDTRPHGKIQVRVVNYVNSLSDLLSNGIVNTITDLGSLIFVLVFMFSINVKLTLLCLMGLPVLTILILIIKVKQRKAWQITSNKQSNLNAYISESINGVRITQAFVREEENIQIFNRLSNAYRQSWMKAVKYTHLISPAVENISTITLSLVYVLGVKWIAGGDVYVTAGVLIAFTGYIGRFWTPINTLASFYNSLINAVAYIERIFETIDEPVEIKDLDGARDINSIKGNISFKDVSFSYEEGVQTLKNVSFDVKAGESFAIVGPTGSGKTTIVNLISRFYNINSGKILIDDIDIYDYTIKSLRTQMGVMMQESFIFSGTIMDNIRYGNTDATDEEVIEAAKVVCAHDFIVKMENGYYTEVRERGSGLSTGQKQLISFARAILANPKILILDEATSSIDTETEIALQKGLSNLLKGRTSFIIAHRLSTIKNCSCILYLQNGQIIEKGSHDELIKKEGEYFKLYMSQYEFFKKK